MISDIDRNDLLIFYLLVCYICLLYTRIIFFYNYPEKLAQAHSGYMPTRWLGLLLKECMIFDEVFWTESVAVVDNS